jgi:hypothetical protein
MEERRQHPRAEPAIRKAFVYLDSRTPLLDCEVVNISESGARVSCKTMLPTHFVLFLVKDGSDRRACKVLWRDGFDAGVVFES